MNAEFFALAFLAALNPKLLALDLLLIENRRPRAMFSWLLAGGLAVGVTIGLLDVLVFHVDAINQQRSVSVGVDLALGLLLLVAGALVAAGRVPGRRRARIPAGGRPPPEQQERAKSGAAGGNTEAGEDGVKAKAGEEGGKAEVGEEGGKAEVGEEGGNKKEGRKKKESWAQRLLAEPRLTLAVLVGAVIGVPGVSYLTALHHLVAGKYPTAIQVIAVIVFVIISFLLIIIPFAFLELRPEGTKARLKSTQAWLLGHAQKLMALVALLLGAYLTISAAVRLS
jgi:Sap, sulfolipid-1-addressing protein